MEILVEYLRLEDRSFPEMLIGNGWLDMFGNGYYIHDWHDHADEATKKVLLKRGERFANGSPVRLGTRGTGDEPEGENGYLPGRESGENESRQPKPKPKPEPKPSYASLWDRLSPLLPSSFHIKEFKDALGIYEAYRREKKFPVYKDVSIKKIAENWSTYTPEEVMSAFTTSILNDYQGCFPKKLGGLKPTVDQQRPTTKEEREARKKAQGELDEF